MALEKTYAGICDPLKIKISTSGKEVFIRIDEKDGTTTIHHLPLFKDEVESIINHFVERVCKAYGVNIIPKVVVDNKRQTRSVYIPQKLEIRLCLSANLNTVLHEIAHHFQYVSSGMKREIAFKKGCEEDAENFAKSHESEWIDSWKVPSLYMDLLYKVYCIKNSLTEKEAVITPTKKTDTFNNNEDRLSMLDRLRVFDRSSRILKKFNPFGSRACPSKLEVNVYTGCAFQCKYCYARAYIRKFEEPRPKANFEKSLREDINLATKLWLTVLPVSISNSCDPLQPLEEEYKHTLLTIELLVKHGFKIIILTKNPTKLLENEYLKVMDKNRTLIEVTIPFLNSKFFEPNAPPTEERIEGSSELIKLGFRVAVRVDPIIPRYGNIPGQSTDEIESLIKKLSDAGIRLVIGKCLRLVGAIVKASPELFYGLRPYYSSKGAWTGNCYELHDVVKNELHMPVYNACLRHNMLYSTCLDRVNLPGSVMCDRSFLTTPDRMPTVSSEGCAWKIRK